MPVGYKLCCDPNHDPNHGEEVIIVQKQTGKVHSNISGQQYDPSKNHQSASATNNHALPMIQ